MSQIVFDIPNDVLLALKVSEEEAELTLRMFAAAKLYELGRLSSGAAARLAGVPRTAFPYAPCRLRHRHISDDGRGLAARDSSYVGLSATPTHPG